MMWMIPSQAPGSGARQGRWRMYCNKSMPLASPSSRLITPQARCLHRIFKLDSALARQSTRTSRQGRDLSEGAAG